MYIPPNPHQEPRSSVTPTGKQAPSLTLASVQSAATAVTPAAQDHTPACPLALTVAPECPYPPFSGSAPAPATAPLLSQPTAPFPQPFSVYLAKHQAPLRAVAGQTPPQQGHSQPPIELSPLQPAYQPLAHEANAISAEDSQAEDLKAVQNAGLHKKFSVCSQEVFAINVDKPEPKLQTLSETLETQMLVSSLTSDPLQRPKSPVPMQGSKINSIQDPASNTEQETSKQGNHICEPDEQVKTVSAETAAPEASSPFAESVPTHAERKSSLPSEIQSSVLDVSVQPTEATNIETEQVSSTSESHSINVTEQSVSSQQNSLQVLEVKSSSQVTIETQNEWSQSVSALTTVSDSPRSSLPTTTVPTQSVSSQSASGFVPVSREQEYSATQFQQQTRQVSSQQSSLISESTELLQTSADTQPSGQPFPSKAQDYAASYPSPMLSALTTAPNRPYSPLLSATKAMEPFPIQTAPVGSHAVYPAAMKPVAPMSLPVSAQTPLNYETTCPSPLLSALTVAPEHPYSPFPAATKAMTPVPLQLAPISTQAVKPVAATPLPAGIQAPLARGAAYPSVLKPASLPTGVQAPLNCEAACPSPLISALTVAPDRPYSPLSVATRPPGFSPSGVTPPVTEQLLRDETQWPLLSAPAQEVSLISKPEFAKTTPKQRPVSSGPLPVIGAFRPIIPATEFKPIISEVVSIKEPHSFFPPVSDELKAEFAVSPAARPKTPIQRVATPASHSCSGTPYQQQKYTATGLQKPAIIPVYQQQMGEYPGQRPRSATPTCPMISPHTHPHQPRLTKPEVPYTPQKPSASFERQPPPQKPYASYQPATASVTAAPVQPQPLTQQPVIPFPNIPLPEELGIAFRPVTVCPGQPCSASQPQPLGPVLRPSPLAASHPTPPALFKPSTMAEPQSAPAIPAEPSISALVPVVPKTVPVLATQPVSIAKTPSAPSSSSVPNAGGGGVGAPGGVQRVASIAGSTAPHRGRGVLTQQSSIAGARIPLCAHCSSQIRYSVGNRHCLFVL